MITMMSCYLCKSNMASDADACPKCGCKVRITKETYKAPYTPPQREETNNCGMTASQWSEFKREWDEGTKKMEDEWRAHGWM